MKTNKRIVALIIACFWVFVLAGCAGKQPVPVTTTTTETTETTTARTTTKTTISYVKHEGPYDDILNAFVELELSGFRVVDEALIGDSQLTYDTYPSGYTVSVVYAFYDINQDDEMELLIGEHVVQKDGEPYDNLLGIYAVQDGKYMSVIQEAYPTFLFLLVDDKGDLVIEHSRGRMDHANNFFYALDKNGKLKTLDMLYTNGRNMENYSEEKGFTLFRAKDVNGKQVDITEQEYLALLQKYGSWGYSTYIKESEIRNFEIEWKSVIIGEKTH